MESIVANTDSYFSSDALRKTSRPQPSHCVDVSCRSHKFIECICNGGLQILDTDILAFDDLQTRS